MKFFKYLRSIKLVVQVIGAVVTATTAFVTLSPTLRSAWASITTTLSPYLDFLKPPYTIYAGILSLAVFLYFAITLYNSWRHRNALLTTLENRVVLDLKDGTGTKAALSQSIQVRADVHDVEVYRHRVSGEGSHSPPTIQAAGYGYQVDPPVMDGGQRCYDLRFLPPLPRGLRVWHSFACEVDDGFTSAQEYFEHRVDYREKSISIEILFPTNRPPQKASAHLVLGLIRSKLGDIDPDAARNGRIRLLWRMKNPELGRSYRIEWEW